MEKLTDREVDIMMAIWHSEFRPVPTGEVLRNAPRTKRNSLQSLQVVMRRLCEKGVVSCEKGRQTNYYSPLISEEEYLRFACENFLSHHYPCNPSAFAVNYIVEHAAQLPDSDLETLRKALEARDTPESES